MLKIRWLGIQVLIQVVTGYWAEKSWGGFTVQQRAAGSSSFSSSSWLLQGCYPHSQLPKFHIQRSQASHGIVLLGVAVSKAPNTEVTSLPLGLRIYYQQSICFITPVVILGGGCLQPGTGISEV